MYSCQILSESSQSIGVISHVLYTLIGRDSWSGNKVGTIKMTFDKYLHRSLVVPHFDVEGPFVSMVYSIFLHEECCGVYKHLSPLCKQQIWGPTRGGDRVDLHVSDEARGRTKRLTNACGDITWLAQPESHNTVIEDLLFLSITQALMRCL